jgi:glycosyltransferase involved in cell wall biosynthesis
MERRPVYFAIYGSGSEVCVRVAVVHDWLYVFGGAERVLRSILQCFPEAHLYTLFDINSDEDRSTIGYSESCTSFLQKMPFISKLHRQYLPLMPFAIEQFDLSRYDLIISSSYAVAKGVITGPDQLHLAYVHSPMRYAWDLQHQYLAESGNGRGIRGMLARTLLHRIRAWDRRTSSGVDAFMANSRFIARRIRKTYGRDAQVIYPPVGVPVVCPMLKKDDFFLTASRLVGYKNIRPIVEAFNDMPTERLIVAGMGPEYDRLRAIAKPNIEFAGFVPEAELRRLMGAARAFVFAAEEDFGIVLVEVQGEGTPVLALQRGGALETVVANGPKATGLFFDEPTPTAIKDAVNRFIELESTFDRQACHENALRFSEDRFMQEFQDFVHDRYSEFRAEICWSRYPIALPPRRDADRDPALSSVFARQQGEVTHKKVTGFAS